MDLTLHSEGKEERIRNKQLTLPVTLALALLTVPLGVALRLIAPEVGNGGVAYYLGVMLEEGLLWGLPALALRPWRSRNVTVREGQAWWCAAAVMLGMTAQCALAALSGMMGIDGGAAIVMPQGTAEWLLAALALVIVPAICEEAFFRGTLFSCLATKTGSAAAFGLTTLMFALMHGSLGGVIAHLVVSAACTLLMLSTGRLRLPILFHCGYNAMALILPLWGNMPWLAAAAIVLAAAAAIIARGIEWKHQGTGLTRTEKVLIAVIFAVEFIRYIF